MIKKMVLMMLRFYKKYLSKGDHCRFTPSCSVYARQAVEKYGAVKGLWWGVKRVVRCNRWNKGGIEEV